jgi:hypothetical protein
MTQHLLQTSYETPGLSSDIHTSSHLDARTSLQDHSLDPHTHPSSATTTTTTFNKYYQGTRKSPMNIQSSLKKPKKRKKSTGNPNIIGALSGVKRNGYGNIN